MDAIEIGEEDLDGSDNESVVEVVEPAKEPEPVEIQEVDDGDEDDVLLKVEPVEQVVVEDDADTDEETQVERTKRDELAAIDFANIKIKQEPVDPDDEPIITADLETPPVTIETTHTTVTSSIDGNVQLDDATAAPALPIGGIRININKVVTSFISPQEDKMLEDISADDEPLPPGEEPELEYKLKPELENVQFSRQPPLQRGNELSGLCSIM